MNTITRRQCLQYAAASALPLAFGVSPAHAADAYPSRPITLTVGFAPGGSGDILARLMGEALAKSLGQPIVVENRPGAGATIATSYVAGAPADGYSLLFVTSGFAGSAALYPKLGYDTATSFAPVARVGDSPIVIVVPAASKIRDFAGLIAAAKAAPGKLNYAAGGGGATTTSMAAEFLKREAGIAMQMIPYKGSGQALTALLANEVDLGFEIPSSALPHIHGGKLRAIAVTSARPTEVLPGGPTVAQSLLPGFEVTGWFGVLAPAGTPKAVVERLNREINAALAQPQVAQRLRELGVEPAGGGSAEFARLIASETRRYGDAIRRLGLSAQ